MMFCVHLTLNKILFPFLNFANKIIHPLNSFLTLFLLRIWARGHHWSKARIKTTFMNGRQPLEWPSPLFILLLRLQLMCGIVGLVIPRPLFGRNYYLVTLFLFLSPLILWCIVMLVLVIRVIGSLLAHLPFPLLNLLKLYILMFGVLLQSCLLISSDFMLFL